MMPLIIRGEEKKIILSKNILKISEDSFSLEILNKIKAPYNINSLTIDAALKRLDEQGVVYQQVSEIIQEKHRLLNEIKNVKFINVLTVQLNLKKKN